ncbi:efflux RND transporter permease subunit [Thermodesulfobacteriota bacterium]
MKSFFHFFAKRHTLANVFTVMIILIGINTLMSLQRAQYPTVDFGEMLIITPYPGASPEDVELNVTNKLEDEIKGVSGIKFMDSYSRENVSTVHIMIEPDVADSEKVKDDVREAVSRVTDFPPEVTQLPSITDLSTSMFPVLEVGLSSSDMPYSELREHARIFEKKLKNVKGIASIARYGFRDREVQIEVSPEKLRDHELSLRDIVVAIKKRNIRASGGSIESYVGEKNIVTMALFDDPMEVADVYVRANIQVKDIAEVTNSFEDEEVISHMNGKPAISFIVTKSETADIIRTVDAIKSLIKKEQQYLPDNVEILFSKDISIQVKNQFTIVKNNGIIGLTLVLILLTLFLNIRAAFWVALGIPVSIFGVISLLPVFDTFLDSITLTAMIIVIGIVVDDGIIISEHIMHRREMGDSPLDAATNGISEVFVPVMTTILTTILAFAPMFFMSGMMGKFVYVIPLTVMLSLLVSLFEIIVALPAHMVPSLRRTAPHSEAIKKNWFIPTKKIFKKYLEKLLRLRYVVLCTAIIVLTSSALYAYKYMNFILTPSEVSNSFIMVLKLPTGTSLESTTDEAKRVEEIVRGLRDDELESYVTRIGAYGDEYIEAARGENYSMITVGLTSYSKRDRTADEIVSDLREKINNLDVYEKVTFRIVAGGPPVGKPVQIRVAGTDDDMREKLANDVKSFVSSIDGVKDIESDNKEGKSQVEIKIDYYELAKLGLTVADISQVVRIAYDGEIVSSIRYGDEDLDFRVQLSKSARERLDYLENLSIPNRDGLFIPLKHVASLKITTGPSDIIHFDGDRIVTITADVEQGKTTPNNVSDAVTEHFDLNRDYPGMRFIIGGEAQETSESMKSLIRVFFIALIGMYLLLLLLFNSPTQPLLVITAIPFGFVGIIIAFALHSAPFSFLAMIGSIGLAGVVVNDSLVLVSHVNKMRRDNPEMPIKEVVLNGTTDRLRAIIMTTVTTVAGLLPLTYGFGGVDAYMAPLAMALGYGLLFATPITLILLPSLYVIGDDLRKIFKRN